MTTFLIIMMLSAMGEILFTISSLTLNLNAQSYQKPQVLPFLLVALGSLVLFSLQQGYGLKELLSQQILYDGLHPASQRDVAVAFSFFAAALLLLFLAYYFVGKFPDLKERLQDTLSRLRFYTVMLTTFVSLSVIPCLGPLSTFSFLFFPGWVFSRSLLRRGTVLKAAGMGALSYLISMLLKLLAPALSVGPQLAISLLFVSVLAGILFRRKRTSYEEK